MDAVSGASDAVGSHISQDADVGAGEKEMHTDTEHHRTAAKTRGGRSQEESEDEEGPHEELMPTMHLYLSPDGTPLVWDPATIWVLRARYRLLPRPIGVPPVQRNHVERVAPAALMPCAAALMLEKGVLTLKEGPARRARHVKDGESDEPTMKRQRCHGEEEGGGKAQAGKKRVLSVEAMRGYHRPLEAERRAVFHDLWDRGLTVGTGAPYGADFTVYEGDPLAFHAFGAVFVMPPSHKLSCRALSQYVRLEQSVAKLLIFAIVSKIGSEAADGYALPGLTPGIGATKFGPARGRVGGFVIDYVTMRFVSVGRRLG